MVAFLSSDVFMSGFPEQKRYPETASELFVQRVSWELLIRWIFYAPTSMWFVGIHETTSSSF